MITLREKYNDQTVWIVGKGPSLKNLKKEHFGDGPIITINQTIVPVEELDLLNPIYSLQKNGGPLRHNIPGDNLSPDCYKECADICGNMVRPKKANLVVHNLESYYCFENYSPRYVFFLEDFGLTVNRCSFVVAIGIGKLFGCSKFRFISFDAHALNHKNYHNQYWCQIPEVKPHLKGLDIEWITP